VIGAGPVGLVLANELARFNIPFRIVEKNAQRSTWSKALMITSRTTSILEDIGLHEEILSKGTVIEGLNAFFNDKPVASINMSNSTNDTIRYPFPVILPQPEVEEAFENVLNKRGGKVEWNSEVVGIKLLKEYVEVRLKSDEIIRAKFVVGCDGAHSTVRKSQSDWHYEGHPLRIVFSQCDATIKDLSIPTTRGHVFVGSSGCLRLYLLMIGFALRLPLYHDKNKFRLITAFPEDFRLDNNEFKHGRVEGRQPTLTEFNYRLQVAMQTHFNEISDPTWLTYFTCQERIVQKLRCRDRLFLAGDAAHCHSPAGGQGMNLGIQDGEIFYRFTEGSA
jgi:2-polyprenyl-6-methoxyphenol hydroxylase-like FAD-dependent oxidoreductase